MTRMIVLLGLVTACGGGAAVPDADPQPDAAPGSFAGELTVLDGGGLGHLWFPPVVFGGFPTDGRPVWHQEVLTTGACRLFEYELGLCDPPCDGVCLAPAECRAWPTYRSAGALTITGLAAALVVDPLFDGRYVTPGGLPDPLFASDASIGVSAAGDVIDAFTVSAAAVARLAVPAFDANGLAVLTDGSDLTITWPGADATSRVQVFVHSGGAPHGTPPQTLLQCDAVDTGSITIPQQAVEALPPLAVGCPKGRDCAKLGIMRYHRATTTTAAGTVTLTVGSGTNYAVQH